VSKQKWLITGGAGYIGTHIADLFIEAGKDVVLLDSLYQGLESRVDYLRAKHGINIPLEVIDVRDYAKVDALIAAGGFTGIIHTAALKAVGESIVKMDQRHQSHHTVLQNCSLKVKSLTSSQFLVTTDHLYVSLMLSVALIKHCLITL